MGIHPGLPMPRKMLQAVERAALRKPFHQRSRQTDNRLRVGGKGARVYNGVVRRISQIRHRGKHPIHPQRAGGACR